MKLTRRQTDDLMTVLYQWFEDNDYEGVGIALPSMAPHEFPAFLRELADELSPMGK